MEINYCLSCMESIPLDAASCPHCGYDSTKAAPSFNTLRPASILHGRYLVGRVLGQGGFGITYAGFDLVLESKAAIKEYFPTGIVSRNHTQSNRLHWDEREGMITQAAGCEDFLKEARKMALLKEVPAIVQVKDMFQENGTAYIVMEYVEGENLQKHLQRTGPLEFSQCMTLLKPLLQDMTKVHAHNLIHRDISPDNIMVRPDGSVCLLDLGAAKDLSVQKGQSSMVVAKSGFSPLEQYSAGSFIGPWTDVYALCATIYYCITGKALPNAIDRIEEPRLTFQGLKGKLTRAQRSALEQGLAVDAEKRIRSVSELIAALEGNPGRGTAAGGAGKRPGKWAAIAAALLLTAGTAGFLLLSQGREAASVQVQSSGVAMDNPGNGSVNLVPGDNLLETALPETEPPETTMPELVDGLFETVGGLTYSYSAERDGWILRDQDNSGGDLEIPSYVYGKPVLEIGRTAFFMCGSLTSVTIPQTVTAIGDQAFEGCTGLREIRIPESVTALGYAAFQGCTGLENAVISGGVRELHATFNGCTALREITLPERIEIIEAYTFVKCAELKEILLPDSLRYLELSAFQHCASLETLIVPEGVGYIGAAWTVDGHALLGCTGLKGISISEGTAYSQYILDELPQGIQAQIQIRPLQRVKTVEDVRYAYMAHYQQGRGGWRAVSGENPKAKRVTIVSEIDGEPVLGIGAQAFYRFRELKTVTIPEGIERIDYEAFSGCTSLQTVTLPNSLTLIDQYAFYDAGKLKEVHLPEGLLYLGDSAFSDTGLKEITVPGSLEYLGLYGFARCKDLSRVVLEDGIRSIGQSAFRENPSLKEVVIPDTVRSIDYYAFAECPKLKEISVPQKVELVGGVEGQGDAAQKYVYRD